MNEFEEQYRRLAKEIFLLAIHDYVSFAFPSLRQTKENKEAFESAAFFLWIDNFYLENFYDDNLEKIHIKDFLKVVAGRENIKDSEEFRLHTDNKLFVTWRNKNMLSKEIPTVLILDGEPYWIFFSGRVKDQFFNQKCIDLKEEPNTDKIWVELFNKALQIYCKKENINLAGEESRGIAQFFYHMIKFNELSKSS